MHTNEVLRVLPFPVVFSFTVTRNSFASSMSSSSTRSHIALSPSLAMTKASTPSPACPVYPRRQHTVLEAYDLSHHLRTAVWRAHYESGLRIRFSPSFSRRSTQKVIHCSSCFKLESLSDGD